MADSPASASGRWAAGLLLVLLVGALVRLPGLSRPLLEGAAGKQTHTAMVARNLYRGRASFVRPRVDDVGKPGYFVKEMPVLPALAAGLYGLAGGVDERLLRLISVLAWLASVPLVAGFLRPALGGRYALLAGFWLVLSPMAIMYSRAAMNDALAVTGSLAALTALGRWRRAPSLGNTALSGALVAAAFLLKPHTAFWLGPAAALLTVAPSTDPAEPRPSLGWMAALTATALGAMSLAGLWYAHAAAVHQVHPVPGATVPDGWIAPALLSRPALYQEIGRQALFMVFTPLGAALAVVGLARGPRLRLMEWALSLWGGGVILQCVVFAPRMFDDLSRGTEYYQLPLVATAAWLIARGLKELSAWIPSRRGAREARVVGAACALLAVGAFFATRDAMRIPRQYETLIADCERIQSITQPTDEFVVLADRGGTVLYYCDRRGHTFSLATAVNESIVETSERATELELSRAFQGARYLYVPFPELFEGQPELLTRVAERWQEVPLAGARARLFARPTDPRGRAR